jgi:hypothetical protein
VKLRADTHRGQRGRAERGLAAGRQPYAAPDEARGAFHALLGSRRMKVFGDLRGFRVEGLFEVPLDGAIARG